MVPASESLRVHLSSAIAVCTLCIVISAAARAQTFTVLHNFSGAADGAQPMAGLSMDRAGNLYGTASAGGGGSACPGGCGTVYRLSARGAGWVFTPLYAFRGGSDGAQPLARVTVGPNGSLYGTTFFAGNGTGWTGDGVVYNLKPPTHVEANIFAPWNLTVLYGFGNAPDASNPLGDIAFDASGAIYGATVNGGSPCEGQFTCGAVYRLAPSAGGWTEQVIYPFTDPNVAFPQAGVTLDAAGNVYGTTSNGPGAVYQLVRSGSEWSEHTLYSFSYGDGPWYPLAGVIFDPDGNLLGTTSLGGSNGIGTVFELSHSGSGWQSQAIFNFTDGGDPRASLVRDAAGNLYGTTCQGGSHLNGSVFKLAPTGLGWIQTNVYEFTGGTDGSCPLGNVVLDSNGTIFGTASAGGSYGYGVVFKISQ